MVYSHTRRPGVGGEEAGTFSKSNLYAEPAHVAEVNQCLEALGAMEENPDV